MRLNWLKVFFFCISHLLSNCKWFFFSIQTLDEDIFPHWFDIARLSLKDFVELILDSDDHPLKLLINYIHLSFTHARVNTQFMGWWKKRIYFLSCGSRFISCNFPSQIFESSTVGKCTFLGCWKTLLELKTLGMQLAQIGSERIFEKVSLPRHVFGSIYA